ncbi:enoyl-CoA hydratase [Deltaproteobacteria bacterium TL4]
MMMLEPLSRKILVEKKEALGWVIFNTPERRNAISLDMWQAIPEIIEHLNQDETVRVILLKGAGEEAFVAGADISEFKELRNNLASARSYSRTTSLAFEAIRDSQKPTIAMIRGFCMGGGCAISLCCDLRIAADDAKFAIPAAKLGIAYGYENVKQVVRVVGPAYAREILYTAKTYDVQEALRMGLIHHCVSVPELASYTENYALRLSLNAPLSVAAAKICIDASLKGADADTDRVERIVAQCMESQDYQEGYQAFLEKRKPAFQGH